MAKEKQQPKFTPYDEKWEKAADRLARSFCPTIYPCKHCGGPVVHGYCCQYCGSSNPSSKNDNPNE